MEKENQVGVVVSTKNKRTMSKYHHWWLNIMMKKTCKFKWCCENFLI